MTSGTAVAASGLTLGLLWLWWGRRARAPGGSREFGAWAFSSALNDPESVLAQARGVGVNHLDVMVNGNDDPAWHVAEFDKIRRAVGVWKAGGLHVSVTSWVRPRADWVAGLGALADLCRELGVGLTLDVEEPWTTEVRGMAATERESWAARVFAAIGHGVRVAGTAIVFCEPELVGPLLRRCAYTVPQAYATKKNAGHLVAGRLEELAVERYRQFGRPIVLGAAAWNLTGAYGLAALGAIETSMRAARKLGCGVRFWHLHFLAADWRLAAAARVGFA